MRELHRQHPPGATGEAIMQASVLQLLSPSNDNYSYGRRTAIPTQMLHSKNSLKDAHAHPDKSREGAFPNQDTRIPDPTRRALVLSGQKVREMDLTKQIGAQPARPDMPPLSHQDLPGLSPSAPSET